MTMKDGLVRQADRFKKKIAGSDLSQYKVVKLGQLVVGFPIDEAVLAFQRVVEAGIVSPAYGVWDLKDSQTTDRDYLERFLRSPRAIRFYKSRLQGSTARRRSLPNPVFLEMEVPFPPLVEQRRIAAILDQVDALRAQRRQTIAHLDTLARASFLTLVGDPAMNPMEWPTATLGSLGTITTGNTPPRKDPSNFGECIEWIKTDNVNIPGAGLGHATEKLSETGAAKARIVDQGSILMTCIAGSSKVIGNVALADRRVAFNQQINAFTPYAGPSLYWFALLRASQPIVQAVATGGMTSLVSKSTLSGIAVIDAPLAVQREVAVREAAVERLKEQHQRHLAELDTLFASLQHRAFTGQL